MSREHVCDDCGEPFTLPWRANAAKAVLCCDCDERQQDRRQAEFWRRYGRVVVLEPNIARIYATIEVKRLLDGLPQPARFVIERRFGLDGTDQMTLEDIGRSLKMTRERVRQIEARAMRMLQEAAGSWVD